jgi:hypothetical protein
VTCRKGFARSTDDRQHHLAEGFQQAFSRRLTGATFGIASEQTGKFHLLLTQTLSDYTLQQGHNAQGDGEQAHQSYSMVIPLHM